MTSVLVVYLGGSGLRAALVAEDGRVRAQRVGRPASGAGGDADPACWWRDLIDAAGGLATEDPVGFAGIQGIAACGMTRTQVLVGVDGESVRTAIGFGDTRAAQVLEQAVAGSDLAGLPEAANLNPYHPAARLLWLNGA